jgi:hypothetical protein
MEKSIIARGAARPPCAAAEGLAEARSGDLFEGASLPFGSSRTPDLE